MIVVTLEPGDFCRLYIDSLTYIRTIAIREHHDEFEPMECLRLLHTIKAEVSMRLEPVLLTAFRRLHVHSLPITELLNINSSLNIILRLLRNVQDCVKEGLSNILFGVHHIDAMGKFEVLVIFELRQACHVSPVVRHTISHISWAFSLGRH